MKLKTPFLLINLKTYAEGIVNAVKIAETAKKISEELSVNIYIAPTHLALGEIARILPSFAQSLDPYEPGAHTGSIATEDLKKHGAVGALINHSEKRLNQKDVQKCVDRCRKNNLISVVCVANEKESGEYARFNPDFIAIEPPELIGGNVSVSTAKPEVVTGSVEIVKSVSKSIGVVCGAGIKNRGDIEKALELGVVGALVSSGIVKAKNVKNAILDAAKGLK